MKAKDTVMSEKEKVRLYNKLLRETTGDYPSEMVDLFIKRQAEISFEAGIKKVVECINQMSHIEQSLVSKAIDGAVYRTMSERDWQSKLKEWGY